MDNKNKLELKIDCKGLDAAIEKAEKLKETFMEMPEVGIESKINDCGLCQAMNCAMRVMKTLQFTYSNGHQGANFRSGLSFDKETQEILIDEELLMQAIIFANPGNEPRKLRLISHEESKRRHEARYPHVYSDTAFALLDKD